MPMLGAAAIALLKSKGLEAVLAEDTAGATAGATRDRASCSQMVGAARDDAMVTTKTESGAVAAGAKGGLMKLDYYVSDANIPQEEAVDLLMAAGACVRTCFNA